MFQPLFITTDDEIDCVICLTFLFVLVAVNALFTPSYQCAHVLLSHYLLQSPFLRVSAGHMRKQYSDCKGRTVPSPHSLVLQLLVTYQE